MLEKNQTVKEFKKGEVMDIKKIEEYKTRIETEIANAIKKFGENAFFDKGPAEVMDLDTLVGDLKEAFYYSVPDLAAMLADLADTEHGEEVVAAILEDIMDSPEADNFEELMDDEVLSQLY